MTVFLTSSPTGPLDNSRPVDGLDPMNRFVDNLAARWPEEARCLILTAAPEDYARNDDMAAFFAWAFAESGLGFSAMDLWDDRAGDLDLQVLHSYDVLLLGGGHVPTQNAFFRRLDLAKKLAGFDGVIVGVSAGSMNAAGEVYAQPELPGEAVDPAYRRWLTGLGLTHINLLPHYQMVRDNDLDGMALFAGITCPDSAGRPFLAIPDGSYLLVENGRTTLWGEGFQVTPEGVVPLQGEGDVLELD